MRPASPAGDMASSPGSMGGPCQACSVAPACCCCGGGGGDGAGWGVFGCCCGGSNCCPCLCCCCCCCGDGGWGACGCCGGDGGSGACGCCCNAFGGVCCCSSGCCTGGSGGDGGRGSCRGTGATAPLSAGFCCMSCASPIACEARPLVSFITSVRVPQTLTSAQQAVVAAGQMCIWILLQCGHQQTRELAASHPSEFLTSCKALHTPTCCLAVPCRDGGTTVAAAAAAPSIAAGAGRPSEPLPGAPLPCCCGQPATKGSCWARAGAVPLPTPPLRLMLPLLPPAIASLRCVWSGGHGTTTSCSGTIQRSSPAGGTCRQVQGKLTSAYGT